jgi:hypothetical protein
LWGTLVSPSTVSDLNKKIYETIEAWHNRPIEGDHPYVYLDGIVLKRSRAGEVRNVSLLVAIGVNERDYRGILRISPVTARRAIRARLHRGIFSIRLFRRTGREFPIQLSLIHDYHGDLTRIPYPSEVKCLNIRHIGADIALVLRDLAKTEAHARPGLLIPGIEHELRILTCTLCEQGFDFAQMRQDVSSAGTSRFGVELRIVLWLPGTP